MTTAETNDKTTTTTTTRGLLILTIYGPFAYWEDETSIQLMGPPCPYHYGVISTIGEIDVTGKKSEFSLKGRRNNDPAGSVVDHQYVLDLGVAGSSKQNPMRAETRILNHAQSKVRKPATTECSFCLTVPKPELYALVNPGPSIIKIVKPGPPQNSPVLAAGLRFVYQNVNPTAINLSLNETETGYIPLTPLFAETGVADIEVHLAGPNRDDPDHEEAWDCFCQLTELLGVRDHYEPRDHVKTIMGVFHGDCYSPVIWVA